MKIRLDVHRTTDLVEKLGESLAKEIRSGIHVSDLLQPLKAYWQKTMPLPPTPEEVGYWLTGRGHHYYLVQAMTGVDDSQEESLIDSDTGLHFSPDLNELQGEFKTSRWWKVPENKEEALQALKSYVPQCIKYACLKNVTTWWLYVLYIMPTNIVTKRRAPVPQVYKLTFTEDELEAERKNIRLTMAALTDALDRKDPSSLPLCAEYTCFYMQGRGRGRRKVLTPTCKWFEFCKPKGRHPDTLEEGKGDIIFKEGLL